MMQQRLGSLLLWLSGTGGATAVPSDWGQLTESEMSEESVCRRSGCTVPKS